MGSLSATGADVRRWIRERRWDILKWAAVLGPEDDPFADLWIADDGEERLRCPFVRKDRGKPTYTCSIYDTRPQVCRDYVPCAEGSICEAVE